MKIAIIGCGWVGKRLAKYLTARNHHVIATTTSPAKIAGLEAVAVEVHLLDFSKNNDFEFLNSADAAIFSMPISRDSWLTGFEKMKNIFPKTILFSSTGIYPQENRTFNENETANLRADILASEDSIRKKYPQTNILRFGGLMGDERSVQNFFTNRIPEHPEKPVNYIHYEDILTIVEEILNSDKKSVIYNIVAPEHPSIGEILNIITENKSVESVETKHRIISSDLFIQDFNYTFIHPNPKYF
ncbi:MAG: NAD-binding protein [Kaistella sp.]|nr:NAD-binding protein [Kaistella sp.]